MLNRTGSLILAIAANLFLAGMFGRALIDPVNSTDFIYKTGLMIFMIEFMSLHSSGMFFGAAQEEQKKGKAVFTLKVKIAMIVLYSVMIVAFAASTGQWWAAVYFILSLASKAFFSRAIDAEQRMAPVAAGVAMLVICTFVVVFSASLLTSWFPFPSEVRAAKPAGQGGLFIDKPQTLMAWGVLYFVVMTLCEIMIYRKATPKRAGSRAPIAQNG